MYVNIVGEAKFDRDPEHVFVAMQANSDVLDPPLNVNTQVYDVTCHLATRFIKHETWMTKTRSVRIFRYIYCYGELYHFYQSCL